MKTLHDLGEAKSLLAGSLFMLLVRLFEQLRVRWSIDYNLDYGIDKRSGYGLTVDGVAYSSFEPTDTEAMLKGLAAYSASLDSQYNEEANQRR